MPILFLGAKKTAFPKNMKHGSCRLLKHYATGSSVLSLVYSVTFPVAKVEFFLICMVVI